MLYDTLPDELSRLSLPVSFVFVSIVPLGSHTCSSFSLITGAFRRLLHSILCHVVSAFSLFLSSLLTPPASCVSHLFPIVSPQIWIFSSLFSPSSPVCFSHVSPHCFPHSLLDVFPQPFVERSFVSDFVFPSSHLPSVSRVFGSSSLSTLHSCCKAPIQEMTKQYVIFQKVYSKKKKAQKSGMRF